MSAHPDTPSKAIDGVFVTYIWQGPAEWSFAFTVMASPAVLKLPQPVEPERARDLWRQTCFGLFLLDSQAGSYLEFGFSPSGQWAANRFGGYRRGEQPHEPVTPPQIQTTDPRQLVLAHRARMRQLGIAADSPLMNFPDIPVPAAPMRHFTLSAHCEDTGLQGSKPWRAGLAAIIEEADGTRSSWALAHPPGEPDFHDAEGFALDLPGRRSRRGRT